MKKQLPRLSERLTSQWLYKIVSLFVALAIWVTTIQGRKDTIVFKAMDVEFKLKPNLVVTNLEDRTVQVKVSGSRASINKFRQGSQVVSVNLTQEPPGLKRVEIKPSDINLPIGVKLISIQPQALDIEIKEFTK